MHAHHNCTVEALRRSIRYPDAHAPQSIYGWAAVQLDRFLEATVLPKLHQRTGGSDPAMGHRFTAAAASPALNAHSFSNSATPKPSDTPVTVYPQTHPEEQALLQQKLKQLVLSNRVSTLLAVSITRVFCDGCSDQHLCLMQNEVR